MAACATRGAPPPVVGFARNTATFDVFYGLQVTNYGVLYVLFNSAPSGSNYIDVWDLCLHAQTVSTIISSQRFSDESRRVQAEKLFDRARKSCTHNQSPIAIRPFTPYGKRTDEQTVFTVSPPTVPGRLPSTLLPMATARHFTLSFPNSRAPNRPMKPTAPQPNTFGELATTPCRGLSLSR